VTGHGDAVEGVKRRQYAPEVGPTATLKRHRDGGPVRVVRDGPRRTFETVEFSPLRLDRLGHAADARRPAVQRQPSLYATTERRQSGPGQFGVVGEVRVPTGDDGGDALPLDVDGTREQRRDRRRASGLGDRLRPLGEQRRRDREVAVGDGDDAVDAFAHHGEGPVQQAGVGDSLRDRIDLVQSVDTVAL